MEVDEVAVAVTLFGGDAGAEYVHKKCVNKYTIHRVNASKPTVFISSLHNSITVWPGSHTGVGSDLNGVHHKLLQSSQYSHCGSDYDSLSHGNRGKGGLCVLHFILSDDSILVYGWNILPIHLDGSR